jgi:hypothetical protein
MGSWHEADETLRGRPASVIIIAIPQAETEAKSLLVKYVELVGPLPPVKVSEMILAVWVRRNYVHQLITSLINWHLRWSSPNGSVSNVTSVVLPNHWVVT